MNLRTSETITSDINNNQSQNQIQIRLDKNSDVLNMSNDNSMFISDQKTKQTTVSSFRINCPSFSNVYRIRIL